MRRLPIFFVLDCSESMAGENIKKMEDGLQAIICNLRTDPHALESVYISVIAFAGIAKTIVPLIELASFYPPKLPLGGGTNLGAALETLMSEVDRTVVRTTAEKKGDWKPIVYLFTDGRPTDSPTRAIKKWCANYAKKTTLIAVGLGNGTDFSILAELTDKLIRFEERNEDDFKKFINWISASVVSQSKSVGEVLPNAGLAAFDESIISLVKNTLNSVDDTCVTLIGRCQRTKKPYIIRYEAARDTLPVRGFKVDMLNYHLAGCYPLDEDYFAWSDKDAPSATVNTLSLLGTPSCPHCGNITAFAVCGCGKLLCVNGPSAVACPWCQKIVSFSAGAPEVDDGFDVDRGRG